MWPVGTRVRIAPQQPLRLNTGDHSAETKSEIPSRRDPYVQRMGLKFSVQYEWKFLKLEVKESKNNTKKPI